VNDEYQVVLNEEDVPRLRINSFYRRILKQRDNSDETAKEFLQEKLKSAVWLIKSIEQRRQTLYKVCKSLVKFQQGFLDHGISHLKPLVLRDVAEDIEMHESTVSRVVTNKYIHTPQGLFELKFFFHSGINFMDGSTMSSVAVKRLLKNMIDQEDGEKPLTDQEIVEILREKQIQIARRTVAKYRKELKIPSSGSRKRSFSFQATADGSLG
jgi:RNA polymerase sigma-54 factor